MTQNDSFSITKGCFFIFEDNGNQIKAWFSALSGKETIFVNNVIVSTGKNYSRNSVSKFRIKNDNYSISLIVKSFIKGPFVCTLSKNEKPFKRKSLIFNNSIRKNNKKYFFYSTILYIVIGIILGACPRIEGFKNNRLH